jgi:hypothetical protein
LNTVFKKYSTQKNYTQLREVETNILFQLYFSMACELKVISPAPFSFLQHQAGHFISTKFSFLQHQAGHFISTKFSFLQHQAGHFISTKFSTARIFMSAGSCLTLMTPAAGRVIVNAACNIST